MVASTVAPTSAAAAPAPPVAPGLQLVVDSEADGPGDCSTDNPGTCTLRAAIEAAAAAAPAVVTIEVPAGTYALTQGPLVLTADGTYIFGAFSPFSVDPSLIDAGGARAFEVDADGVTLAGLAIINADAGNQNGGAVLVKRGVVDFLLSQSSL